MFLYVFVCPPGVGWVVSAIQRPETPLGTNTPGRNMGPDRKWHHTPQNHKSGQCTSSWNAFFLFTFLAAPSSPPLPYRNVGAGDDNCQTTTLTFITPCDLSQPFSTKCGRTCRQIDRHTDRTLQSGLCCQQKGYCCFVVDFCVDTPKYLFCRF